MTQTILTASRIGSPVIAAASIGHGPFRADTDRLAVSNRQIHEAMLAERGIPFDESGLARSTGWGYDLAYETLLSRLGEWPGVQPRLLVGGHAIPDRTIDDAPAVRMLGLVPTLESTFSVADGENLVGFHALEAGAALAPELGVECVAVVLADRGDLGYATGESEPTGNHGVLLLIQGLGDPAGGAVRPAFRFGLTDPVRLEEAATALLADLTATGPAPDGVVIDPELAGRWLPSVPWGDITVGPTGFPATSVFQAALRHPAGTDLVVMGFHAGLGQLAALRFSVPELLS
ncbi:hypothetical protein [Granulicoccus sp. GXG6511]|uniref:hypothetical protein n=1 Tax=Granulicoccus sp. GXG6511 TaxID=3381351 RepID=UPI003D7CE53B